MLHPDQSVHFDQVIPIVVGAHLRAELGDRPRSKRVLEAITSWMELHEVDGPPWPIVCTDLWYLNQVELRTQPTICIGHPEVNAASAALSAKLPTTKLVDDAYRIQLDQEYIELKCCMWGVDDASTDRCIDAFVADFLPTWLGSIFGIRLEN